MVSSLFFTTLIASFYAISVSAQASQSVIVVSDPEDVTQCTDVKLDWKGGIAPWTLTVFTGCGDPNDDPVLVRSGLTESAWTGTLPLFSGETFFVQVVDANGVENTSDDVTVKGDPSKKDQCKAQLESAAKKAAAASSSSVPATTPVPTTASVANNAVPTTMSRTPTGNGGVANAVQNPGAGAGTKGASQSGLPTNGASSLSARPLTVGAGLLAIAVAAML